MMKNKNKSLIIIIIILLVATFGFLYNKVTITSFLTDSGFDSSYSGGHSHSSGSSHSSSRSSSYKSSSRTRKSNTSRSSSSTNPEDAKVGIIAGCIMTFLTFAMFTVIMIIICGVNRKSKPSLSLLSLNKNKAWDNDRFNSIIKNITLEKFLFERVADLVQVQYNWMNFDYNKLREQLTDELYNQYEMQLKTLETKGQKNVMKDFNPIDSMVTNVENINGRYTVTMEVIISFIDYIEQNGTPVRGSSNNPITMHYELVYTSSSNGIVDKCPKCGGELKDTNSQECPYCRTIITQDSTKWVMSKKKALGQR